MPNCWIKKQAKGKKRRKAQLKALGHPHLEGERKERAQHRDEKLTKQDLKNKRKKS